MQFHRHRKSPCGWGMLELSSLIPVAIVLALLALLAWAISFARRDTSIVDSFWALFFLAGLGAYVVASDANGLRAMLVLVLTALWALRLTLYLTFRNWGEPEDRRYQAIRARNEPGYAWKSLYLIFALQGALAFIIAMPLFAIAGSAAPLNALDIAGLALWMIGFGFESIGDWQLARFLRDPSSRGKVMDRGLWRYTRHPNYFGEAVLWWGFYCFALAAGAWWTLFAPVIMSFLLLKISGVALLEKDINERRPSYCDYALRTAAFFPRAPRP